MSTNISFLSFLDFLPVPLANSLMFFMGLLTAEEGALDFVNMFHLDTTLSLILGAARGVITIGSLTVYYLIFSVAISCGCP